MTEQPPAGTPMSERMQALLSRAVEDQLTEQRQAALVLSDLRAQLAQITADVAELRASTAAGGGAASASLEVAVAGIATDLRESVRLLSERVDSVARMVQQRGVDLSDLGDRLGHLETGVAALQSRPAPSAEGGAAVPADNGEVLAAIAALTTEVRRRDEADDEMRSRVEQILERLDALAARSQVQESIAATETRLRAHIEDSMLVLAEVLLSRGAVPPAAASAAPAAAPAPAPAPALAPVEPPFAADPAVPAAAPVSFDAAADVPALSEPPPEAVPQPPAEEPPSFSSAPSVPDPADAPAAPAAQDAVDGGAQDATTGDDDEAGRRRPWWKPGA